jgi:polygalacturonase
MTLHLEAGAQLLGSQSLDDYPLIDTRVAGIDMRWPAAIINIIDCHDVSITGGGTIDGQGLVWWQRFWGDDEQGGMLGDYSARGLRWVVDYDCQRPRNILVYESERITLRDFTSRESGFWNVHLCYSRHITLDSVQISNSAGPSTDGIDIDSANRFGWSAVSSPVTATIFASKRGEDRRQRQKPAAHGILSFVTVR